MDEPNNYLHRRQAQILTWLLVFVSGATTLFLVVVFVLWVIAFLNFTGGTKMLW